MFRIIQYVEKDKCVLYDSVEDACLSQATKTIELSNYWEIYFSSETNKKLGTRYRGKTIYFSSARYRFNLHILPILYSCPVWIHRLFKDF